MTFDVTKLLGEDIFPHKFVFTAENAFKDLEVHYRDRPADWLDIALGAIDEELKELGFPDPKAAFLHLVNGREFLTGAEYIAFEDVYDKLKSGDKVTLEGLLIKGINAVLPKIVGAWNANIPIATGLPAVIAKFPSLSRALFELSQTVSLLPEKKTSSAK